MRVGMLGSFPPLRALSSYCLSLSAAIANHPEVEKVEFLSFKRIYPPFLYPGGSVPDDETFPEQANPALQVHRKMTWYNPLTWMHAGLFPKVDVLHAQWWSLPLAPVYAIVLSLCRARKIPVVFTVHNVLSHEKTGLYETISGMLYPLGNHFIVHTDRNVEQLKSYYQISHDRISRIPHGALDFMVEKVEDREGLRREMGIEKNDPVILLFGAIRFYKGVDTAIEALGLVQEEIPNARLLVAGKLWESFEPYRELIQKHSLEKNVILKLDYIPSNEVYRYFEASDLVVLPYHHFDSQSGVGSCAISFEKPMIVTDVGGLPDFVEDKGMIVAPKNAEALADAFKRVLTNKKTLARLKEQAKNRAKAFTWTDIADKTVSVYRGLQKENK